MENEPEAEAQEHASSYGSASGEKIDESPKWRPATMFVGCASILVAGLILLFLFSFIAGAFHSPWLTTLSVADRWVAFIANLIVVFYAFPTFKLTKDRAFLYLGFGALSFAYSALFSLLLGIRPPVTAWWWTRPQVQLYYATRYAATMIGLALYAWGIVLLARSAKLRHTRKVQLDNAAGDESTK